MIQFSIILNVIIGMFIYNIILKAFGAVLMREFMKSDTLQKEKKSFREKAPQEKMDQEVVNNKKQS